MTHQAAVSTLGYIWAALGIVWLVGLAFTKRTIRRQPTGSRLFHVAIALTGFSLLGNTWFADGWLASRMIPHSSGLDFAGIFITFAGCAFAVWARLTIGSNWSGSATVKAGHELVTNGPYALARHPIYSGLVTAALGTAVAEGEIRCTLGLALILLAFMIKMSQEEKLMMQTFPEEYPRYRKRVKALIPGVL